MSDLKDGVAEQELREIAKEMREECSPGCSCKCELDGPESSPDSVYRAKHDSNCEVWEFLLRAYNLGAQRKEAVRPT